jgi:uncharacterized membrane protein
MLLTVVAALAISQRTECSTVTGTDEVSIDTSSLARGTARTFCYRDREGERLRFVLARDDRGIVRTVFDACRQCFTYHRGYEVSHGELVCRVCGNHYSLAHMDMGKASCVPASLGHREVGNSVRIRTSDLAVGATLF